MNFAKVLELLESTFGFDNSTEKDATYLIKEIYQAVLRERTQQNEQWGGHEHDLQHTDIEWCVLLNTFAARVQREGLSPKDKATAITKVVAIAVAWLQTTVRKVNEIPVPEVSGEVAAGALGTLLANVLTNKDHPAYDCRDCIFTAFQESDYVACYYHVVKGTGMSMDALLNWKPKKETSSGMMTIHDLDNYAQGMKHRDRFFAYLELFSVMVVNYENKKVMAVLNRVANGQLMAKLAFGDLESRFGNLLMIDFIRDGQSFPVTPKEMDSLEDLFKTFYFAYSEDSTLIKREVTDSLINFLRTGGSVNEIKDKLYKDKLYKE